MSSSFTIFVCPLNWGLGHATRDIYIIRHLLKYGHRVILGGDKTALSVLTSEFPHLQAARIPDISIRYNRILPAWFIILLQIPLIVYGMIREHYLLKNIIKTLHADIIISDNRYGLWNKGTISIFISHQLSPKLPFLLKPAEPVLSWLISCICRHFDYFWIPDSPGPVNLSGSLSSVFRPSGRTRHTGILSRFMDIPVPRGHSQGPELLIILSGPEPQRTIFQKILMSQSARFPGQCLIVAGEMHKTCSKMVTPLCSMVSWLNSRELSEVICSARYIICRSGYSGIMDLISLKKKALLVPTPGQTEQEYLARHLQANSFFPFMKQREFDINEAVSILENFPFKSIDTPVGLLDSVLEEMTASI